MLISLVAHVGPFTENYRLRSLFNVTPGPDRIHGHVAQSLDSARVH